MARDAYLKLEGVPGECQDSDHSEWIELLAFEHEFSQPQSATESSAGGGTVGRVNMGNFNVTKYIDRATPKLSEYCCSGKHVASATIDLMRAAGDKRVKYLEIKMEDLVVTKVIHGRSDEATDKFPTESISLNCATIKWTYTVQKREGGGAAGQVTGGWNMKAHKAHA